MQIWVDADACLGVIKEILPRSYPHPDHVDLGSQSSIAHTRFTVYKNAASTSGFDVADNRIVDLKVIPPEK